MKISVYSAKRKNSYKTAVKILRADGEHDAEIAVSLINLAHLYDKAGCNAGAIYKLLDDAWEILTAVSRKERKFCFCMFKVCSFV